MNLQAGDIILVRGSSFLAKGIQFFMNMYRKKKGMPKEKLYNHVAVVINIWGELKIAEAERKGIEAYKDDYKYVEEHDCLVLTWKKPLLKKEQEEFSKLATKYAFNPTRYEFLNFIHNSVYIATGKWIGRRGSKSENVLYCSEYAAILMDKVRGAFGGKGKTWDKNPYDIQKNQYLKIKQ